MKRQNNSNGFTRALSSILTISLLVCVIPFAVTRTNAFASTLSVEGRVVDSTEFVDKETHHLNRLDLITVDASDLSRRGLTSGTTVSRNYVNNQLEWTLFVDISSNMLLYEYPDGTANLQKLSDVVTINNNPVNISSLEKETAAKIQVEETVTPYAVKSYTDYISTSEPFTLSSSGSQVALPNAPWYGGYQGMGYRYNFVSGIYGYLLRRNVGLVSSNYAYMFQFSAGTTAGTIITIIGAALLGNVPGLVIEIIGLMVNAIWASCNKTFSMQFLNLGYQYHYIVRQNSYTGSLLFYTNRYKYWWMLKNDNNGAITYKFDSSRAGGYLQSNSVMVSDAIQ
ncbi:MAG: hypothetical protein GX796_00440 [Clostridiaceae bacterium]|jgi:Flp pilus assembly protein TadG|nr:hypothetical protein [Clostridiaceae bacterium]